MARLLLIEDEQVIRSALKRLLERHGFDVIEAGSIPEAMAAGRALSDTTTDAKKPASKLAGNEPLAAFDLIITDVRLPGVPGTSLLQQQDQDPTRMPPVLVMTSFASVKSAVDTMRLGAADYIAKPFKHEELLQSIKRILDRQSSAAGTEQRPDTDQTCRTIRRNIIGDCDAMHSVFTRMAKVAPTDSTVLILGESGTGKELIARALHDNSSRSAKPLIAVNCAAIPDNLIESELFGHEKGAFTGAVSARAGLVEAAAGGTLFLDEIGELPLNAQARLLRVLQEGEVRRLGTAKSVQVDVRLIAATHRDLRQCVRDGVIRNDLYYRLRVVEIHLPPLRERGDDLIKLAEHLLQKACQRLSRPTLRFAPQTLQAMSAYRWPGNVRELENAVERAAILCDGDTVSPELLAIEREHGALAAEACHDNHTAMPVDDRAGRAVISDLTGSSQESIAAQQALSLDDYLRHFVISHQTQLTETELAKRLGISRKSLWERRQRLGIPRPQRRTSV